MAKNSAIVSNGSVCKSNAIFLYGTCIVLSVSL